MHYLYFLRNAEGCTPFMYAVKGRAYMAAMTLLDVIKKVATPREGADVDKAILMSMLYPTGSSLDNSPLQVSTTGLWKCLLLYHRQSFLSGVIRWAIQN